MSTIGSGINGVLQGQTPSKGKSAQGKATGIPQKSDFADTIANLQGKSGDGGGRKAGRISISETNRNQAEQTAETRGKAGQRDLAALAEVLQEASLGSTTQEKTVPRADGTEHTGSPPGKTHGEDRGTGKTEAQKDDRPKVGHEGKVANEPRTRAPGENVKAAAEDDEGDNTVEVADETTTAKTDVGNLLEMLAAPAAIPHAVVNGAATQVAASGATKDVKAQVDGRASAKAEGQAGAKTDATAPVEAADAGDLPESDTDQLFRLIRADGKGRDLDMSISGRGERATVRDATQTTAAKVETVTVVDSRRYIGLAQTGNAGAVTSAIVQDPDWAASLSSTSGLSHSEAAVTGKVVNTLKIQMNPVELGLVTATLRLHGDALVVSLQVETGEAYRQLSDDQDAIVKALRGHGFAVDQVSVQLSPVDRSAGTQQQADGQAQQQQQQFSSQPQAREGGNGRQGGNGDGTRTFAGEGTSHDGNTSENASGLSGSQPVRSGGVYL